jgi:hypothetical protein
MQKETDISITKRTDINLLANETSLEPIIKMYADDNLTTTTSPSFVLITSPVYYSLIIQSILYPTWHVPVPTPTPDPSPTQTHPP